MTSIEYSDFGSTNILFTFTIQAGTLALNFAHTATNLLTLMLSIESIVSTIIRYTIYDYNALVNIWRNFSNVYIGHWLDPSDIGGLSEIKKKLVSITNKISQVS